ncbi:tRNA lysidine(34) synthetase TilS [Magnetospirillum sp. SS-4]|uniref:tRNA lysidine(34) synthetase TilS n=1 Tax=Magnetospirillum sp. SS-4 TaxID=2681465 RepID=UPI00138081FD|nr:tRNA lysidine(34) synthetase TilS [Magnetospirillum sp. SS-4]CAA7616244.1 tRNA(Ile)-lysidine synthase [Magnetospirillum sp. SS-4]
MTAAALGSDEFAALMARLEPFGSPPRLAVAVSGGADSLALALLAAGWAVARGGEAVAVTVDHRLRPESGREAAMVGDWLGRRGISHVSLPWTGVKPAAGIQAAAREARYRLLGGFCADRSIRHLLLAHHREDQAETVLLRLGRGSGVDGLSAMAAERPTAWGRLVRPLLDVPRDRLRATLAAQGQDWVEDSSNANSAFARVRLRRLAPALAAEGLTAERLAATARRMGRARAALEQVTTEAAARLAGLHPAGFIRCDAAGLARLPDEIGLRLLSRLLRAVGGGDYPSRLERLERLHGDVATGLERPRTLAGCRVVPDGGDHILICREPARTAPPVAVIGGQTFVWDGRFRVEVAETPPPGLRLGALGSRRIAAVSGVEWLPACVRPTLPALFDQDGVSAVPHLGYNHRVATAALLRLEPAWPAEAGRVLVWP